ncbi:MAG: hypothetical protein F6K22_39580 [Okeania sp. SIO2F4]|nr:hypothetical protein [Okeania sp. SIO2F4]
MNKAKTLKRRLGDPKPFLSVAWDTDDIPDPVCINPNLKWRDINWRRVEKNVFKLHAFNLQSIQPWRNPLSGVNTKDF